MMDGKPGLALSAFACLLTVIGLAIPFWSYSSNDYGIGVSSSSYSGLWTWCTSISGSSPKCDSLLIVRMYYWSAFPLMFIFLYFNIASVFSRKRRFIYGMYSSRNLQLGGFICANFRRLSQCLNPHMHYL